MKLFGLAFMIGISLSQCSLTDRVPASTNVYDKRSRGAFVRQMAQVVPGLPKREVIKLLGTPDRVAQKGERICWYYGVGEISGFPTLGQVHFNQEEQVTTVYGSSGVPPTTQQMPESKLRHLIDLIASLDREGRYPDTLSFDPTPFIRVANQLIPEGKATVLFAVTEYLRVSDSNYSPHIENVDLLLRILFTPPIDRYLRPPVSVVAPHPDVLNKESLPRFPLVLIGDVPILSINASYMRWSGAWVGNSAEKEAYLKDIHRHGVMRTSLLKPPSNPLALFDKIAVSDQWYWSSECKKETPIESYDAAGKLMYSQQGKQNTLHQLLRLVRPVYPAARKYFQNDTLTGNLTGLPKITDTEWQQCRQEVALLKLQWNPQTNRYQASK